MALGDCRHHVISNPREDIPLAPAGKRKQLSTLWDFYEVPTRVRLNEILWCWCPSTRSFFWGKLRAELGLRLWVQLGSMVEALMSLSVNYRGCLEYPTASSPRGDGIMSVPNLVEYAFVTFGWPCMSGVSGN
jgi:hypothetical protein